LAVAAAKAARNGRVPRFIVESFSGRPTPVVGIALSVRI
jgi:hypothetical protein